MLAIYDMMSVSDIGPRRLVDQHRQRRRRVVGPISPTRSACRVALRALYGNFPRVIARYVRERHVLTLQDAIRKMTS